jgi:tRNA nucleotidyltransferase/poly(A) polymerase
MKDFNSLLNLEADQIRPMLKHLDEAGILSEILPELCALKGSDGGHKDNFIHTLIVIENTYHATRDPRIRLVAFLHDIGKAVTKKYIKGSGWTFHQHEFVGGKMLAPIFKRLDINKDYYEYVHKLVTNHGYPKELTINVSDSALRRFGNELGSELEDLFLFCKCDLTTANANKKERQINAYNNLYKEIIRVREEDEKAKWRCPIDGNLIMKHFGIKGRAVGDIKLKVETAIKSGQIPDSYEAAFEYMKTLKS